MTQMIGLADKDIKIVIIMIVHMFKKAEKSISILGRNLKIYKSPKSVFWR